LIKTGEISSISGTAATRIARFGRRESVSERRQPDRRHGGFPLRALPPEAPCRPLPTLNKSPKTPINYFKYSGLSIQPDVQRAGPDRPATSVALILL
jgi:hypothetical protein